MDNYSKKKLFEIPNSKANQYSVGGAIFNPPSKSKIPSPTIGFTGLDGSTVGLPTEVKTPTQSGEEQATEPSTIAEMIASSSNPELELQKYMYESGLEDVFSSYQKNIASLDKARQQDIADAYFVREMSKKYLGEYASNAGIGDVSGNLIDIYANYAENLSYIGQNYEQLKTGYESKMLEKEKDLSQKLLQTEVGLEMSEYQQTILSAQTDIPEMIVSGDYGDYSTLEEYVNSLNLPDTYKTDLLEWANKEKDYYEQNTFVSIKGGYTNQTDLDRFGISSMENIDLNYFSDEELLSDYAFVKGGKYYGLSSTTSQIPASALTDFNYQVGGFVVYEGETYMYMGKDENGENEFHKTVQVDSEFSSIPKKNGEVIEWTDKLWNSTLIYNYNGLDYTYSQKIANNNSSNYTTEMLEAFGLTVNTSESNKSKFISTENPEGEYKVAFYDGKLYAIVYDGEYATIMELKRK